MSENTYRATFIAPVSAEHPSRDEILGALGELVDGEQELQRSRPHISSATPTEIHTELGEYVMELSASSEDDAATKIRDALAAKDAEPKQLKVQQVS
jgi:hypothetical protein